MRAVQEIVSTVLENSNLTISDDARRAVTMAVCLGIREGLTRYAWWKNGVQYVGSCGTTLRAALKDADYEAMECS